MNAGGRGRCVLVKDQKGLPGVSVGAGYTYTRFGLVLPGLFSLIPEILPGLALDGTMVARTSLHTAGVELGLSKKLLFVAPFLRMGAWYQWASYTGGIDGFAVTLGGVPQPGVEVLEPQVRSIHALAFVAAAGIELVLGKASLIAQGSYDTASASPAASGTFQLRF